VRLVLEQALVAGLPEAVLALGVLARHLLLVEAGPDALDQVLGHRSGLAQAGEQARDTGGVLVLAHPRPPFGWWSPPVSDAGAGPEVPASYAPASRRARARV